MVDEFDNNIKQKFSTIQSPEAFETSVTFVGASGSAPRNSTSPRSGCYDCREFPEEITVEGRRNEDGKSSVQNVKIMPRKGEEFI